MSRTKMPDSSSAKATRKRYEYSGDLDSPHPKTDGENHWETTIDPTGTCSTTNHCGKRETTYNETA